MKNISVSNNSLLRDIERANKKEDAIKLLSAIIASGITLTAIDSGLYGSGINPQRPEIFENIRNGSVILSLIAGLKILSTRLISYNAKLRLERIVDLLEEEKIFIGVDSLQEANICTIPNDETKEPKSHIAELTLEDRRGNEVVLREFQNSSISHYEYDVELLETDDKLKLKLK